MTTQSPTRPSMTKPHNPRERKLALEAAAALMVLSLRPQCPVDIFCDGLFWKARVTMVNGDGFEYRYCGIDEVGRVLFRDLHQSWRFPLGRKSKHYTAESILLMV